MKLVVGAAIAAGVLVPAAFGSFYQIQEQEQAVLVTFGKPKAVTETGLHFKLPFIQEVRKVNTTIQGFPVGYTEENNEMVEAESIMITSDYNFIDVDFFVEYRISDP
ncbi:MAG: FtsH protease activity modulator HflK, partial [Clostridiales bacterium]|nr:FtsH protease activity modulator HflK [Clostridiales bacterium]